MSKPGLRIMYMANAPWATTGYGVQSNSLIPRLMDMPEVEDVALFPFYGIEGATTRIRVGVGQGITKLRWVDCYNRRVDGFGNDIVHDHAADFGTDLVITLLDIWVLADDFAHRGFRWCPWFPIDAAPTPQVIVDKARQAYRPLVYSKFAQAEMERNDIAATYIPHGVETKLYKPYRLFERREAKSLLAIPEDAFVIGTVAANKGYPSRKGFPQLFEAFRIFAERHADAWLYMHSLVTGEFGGPDLNQMAARFGPQVQQRTRFVDPYKLHRGIDTETMNMIYNAFDVFVLPSRGEGFGVPLIEAQAAGTPVIATDFTAMPELVGAGWKVPPAALDDSLSTPGGWQAIISVPHLVEAFEMAYAAWQDPVSRRDYSAQAREFAMAYDWDAVVEAYWKPFIQELAAEILPRTYRRGE